MINWLTRLQAAEVKPMFKIREAKVSDYDQVAVLYKELYNTHYTNQPEHFAKKAEPLDQHVFESNIYLDNKKVFLVEKTKEVMAFATIRITNETISHKAHIFIEEFCVRSDMRGKGIGGHLFEKIKRYGKKIGATEIELNVWNFNNRAEDFYVKMGMQTRSKRMGISLK